MRKCAEKKQGEESTGPSEDAKMSEDKSSNNSKMSYEKDNEVNINLIKLQSASPRSSNSVEGFQEQEDINMVVGSKTVLQEAHQDEAAQNDESG